MSKRFTLLTSDPDKQVIHFMAMSNNEAKEKGNTLANVRETKVIAILEGWTQPVNYTQEGKDVIKVR